jgi:hypothetical protein
VAPAPVVPAVEWVLRGDMARRASTCSISHTVIYRLDLHDVDVVLFLIVMDADR